jgi:YggT family protein
MLLTAITRVDVANYVGWVFYVYILIIFVYVLLNLLFSTGVRPPYSRVTDSVLTFLKDTSEPYLRLFRRFIPPIGMFDLSPMVAIIVLYFLREVVTQAIAHWA